MKIKFVDTNKGLVDKIHKYIPHFECICGDIFKQEGVIVSASNPNFTFGGGLDAQISKKYPEECKEKQSKLGGNERIGNIIFTITVDNNLKSNKVLIREALQSIFMYGEENETILLSGLGTAIGGLSEDDFIDILKDFFPNRAFKGMDTDMSCRKYKFEIGKTYKENEAQLCNSGFHYCQKLENIYLYYNTNSRIFEIEIKGIVDFGLDKDCSKSIKIIRELNKYELKIYKSKTNTGNWNTGDRNTGNWNTGDRNTGNRNTGDRNTGNRNTGDRNTGNSNTGNWNTGNRNTGNSNTGDRNTGNSNTGNWNTGNRNTGNSNTGDRNTGNSNTGNSNTGDRNTGNSNTGNSNTGNWNTGNSNTGNWNTGDRNTGFFNIDTPNIRIFGKETNKKNIEFPSYFYFDLCVWVSIENMSIEEKIQEPLYGILGGYLKKYDYKEAWLLSFNKCSKEEATQTIKLPNFNYKIFKEITGITKNMLEKKIKG